MLSLKATNPPEEELLKAQNKFATDISQKTTSIGFVAGLLVIFGGLGIVIGTNNSDFGLQYSISFGGGWWLVWSIIPLFLLKKHPRSPLPSTENKFLYPYKRTFKTIRSASKLWQTMKFLISWFFLSDGINTIGPLAALFGQTTFNLTDTELIIIAIVVPLTAAIGVFIFGFIERFFGLKTRTMILINSFLLALLPIYVLIGFIAPFGLKQRWEVWLFVIYFGLSLGSVQAYYQAMFSYLIPKGHENEFFSLYLITAKGSSWLGPLVTGAITDYTHQIRSGFWFLVFSLLIPCIIILTVDVDKGKDDAEKFAITEREEEKDDAEKFAITEREEEKDQEQ